MQVDSEIMSDEYRVRWSNHNRSLFNVLEKFCADETYADCSLAADGEEIAAHKIILSACSPFLNNLLRKHREKHPVIVLRDVSYQDLYAVVEYMYKGEVQVPQNRIQSFFKVAQTLQVSGLFPAEECKSDKKRTWSDATIDDSGLIKRIFIPEKPVDVDETEVLDEGVEYLSEVSDHEEAKVDEDYDWFLVEDDVEGKIEPDDPLKDSTATTIPSVFEPTASPPAAKATARKINKSIKEEQLPPQLSRARIARFEDYNISCSKCNSIYKSETTFLNHLRYDCNQMHTCDTCQKVFKNKRHLLDHVRDDCGRVHVCPRCNRPFKQKVNLTTHQKHYCKLTGPRQSLSPI